MEEGPRLYLILANLLLLLSLFLELGRLNSPGSLPTFICSDSVKRVRGCALFIQNSWCLSFTIQIVKFILCLFCVCVCLFGDIFYFCLLFPLSQIAWGRTYIQQNAPILNVLLESFLRCVPLFIHIANEMECFHHHPKFSHSWRQSHFPHKAPGNHKSALCHYLTIWSFLDFMKIGSYHIYSFVPGFFNSECFWDSSMFIYIYWDLSVSVCLSVCLSIYLSIYLSIMYQQSLPFYCWVVFPCVNIPKLIWFTGWKAFGWLPVCGYYEESCYKHYCIYFCVNIYFQILSQYLVVESLRLHAKFMFTVWLSKHFTKWCTILHSHQ